MDALDQIVYDTEGKARMSQQAGRQVRMCLYSWSLQMHDISKLIQLILVLRPHLCTLMVDTFSA